MSKEKELTGKHVLIMILSFFGVIFSVNGFMIYQSQTSWTGLETKDAYRKGIKYNGQLSASRTQNLRGWSVDVKREVMANGLTRFTVKPVDKSKEPLTQLKLAVELKRPTHEGMDQIVQLAENGLGIYVGETENAVALGKWYLFVTARRKGETLYKSKNELYLR